MHEKVRTPSRRGQVEGLRETQVLKRVTWKTGFIRRDCGHNRTAQGKYSTHVYRPNKGQRDGGWEAASFQRCGSLQKFLRTMNPKGAQASNTNHATIPLGNLLLPEVLKNKLFQQALTPLGISD